jgi:hypothetical protein
MISICSIDQDADGQVLFKEDVPVRKHNATARINRIGTLDGTTVLNHLGFSDGDGNIEINTSNLTVTQELKLLDFFENDSGVICATDLGVYFGAIATLNINTKPSRIRILLQSKMSA